MDEHIESNASPQLTPSISEVQGVFPSEAALETAMSGLTLAGFDRAAFSLPHTQPASGSATPEQGADTPITDTDVRQTRTMGTSMAGTIGAFAAAGATMVATGGAAGLAMAAVAAAAIGAGSALAANAAGNAAGAAPETEDAGCGRCRRENWCFRCSRGHAG